MILINSNILDANRNDVQNEIERRISVFKTLYPEGSLVRLDGSDSVMPLISSAKQAIAHGAEEMTRSAYSNPSVPVRGYPFLLDAIVKNDFKNIYPRIQPEDIFINSGAKQDVTGIGDILCKDNHIGIIEPNSQTYLRSSVVGYGQCSAISSLSIRNGSECTFLPPSNHIDIVFLSFPNNPTGLSIDRKSLTQWVQYAIDNEALILFDATYSEFIGSKHKDVPRSIYEIDGAYKVAIEFHSFTKLGLTGLHCGYTVIPSKIRGYSSVYNKQVSLNKLWLQRLSIKSHVPSYIMQRAAESLYSYKGKRIVKSNIDYYMHNTAILRQSLKEARMSFCGGEDAPYLWVQSPDGDAWRFFDQLLYECNVVCMPGEMFGSNPEGCVRLSGFAQNSEVIRASVKIADFKPR